MADTPNVCGYWHYIKITPEDISPAQYGYRCVAANGFFTGQSWQPDDIDCFNEDTLYSSTEHWVPLGYCDGQGGVKFCWETCNRYRPSGMGFGKIAPVGDNTVVNQFLVSNEGHLEWSEYQQYRLPFKHQVYNLRAKLSKCCYWDGNTSDDFTIDLATGNIQLLGENIEIDDRFPTTKCTHGDDRINENRPQQPGKNLPCNGALPECPWYTGVSWEHCVEDKMQEGDKITASQIQELRFYSDEWSDYTSPYTVFKSRFIDPEIYAWYYNTDLERGVYYSRPYDGEPGTAKETEYPLIGYETVPVLDKVTISLPDGNITSGGKIVPAGGTPTKDSAKSQPNYPTLIKELQEAVSLRPRIVFPHKDYVHRYWTPDGQKVTVIGVAKQASDIYVVNSKTHKVPSQLLKLQAKEAEGKFITSAERAEVGTLIETYLDEIRTYFYDDYLRVSADEDSGYFLAEAVNLELDTKQDIYVFALVGTDWYFSSVNVESKFYHSFPIQTNFNCRSWTDAYIWDGYASGQFYHAKGSCKVKKFMWRMKHEGYTYSAGSFGTLWRYSYNVIKRAEQTVTVDENDWWPLSSCGEVLVRIDDIEINRAEGWEITSAELSDGTRTTILSTTPLYPSNLYTGLVEYFPANYVILGPEDGEIAKHYKKDQTTLVIKYRRYEDRRTPVTLDAGEERVDPSGGAYINIDIARYTETYGDNSWDVADIYEYNPIFRAYFTDETGRVVGVKTFRLLIQYKTCWCRDFEIKYNWTADYTLWKWHPSRWCCDPNGIAWTLENMGKGSYSMTPECGDHEVGRFFQVGIGPMWYPYLECDPDIRYMAGEIGNVCEIPIECNFTGGGAEATCGWWNHRLRAPDNSYALTFGDPNPAIFSCRLMYEYGYAEKVTPNMFNGWGASRGEVDLFEYILNQWKLPQFGNVLREQTWVNRSIAFEQYFNSYYGYFEWKWMPLLEDYSEIEDVFSEEDTHPFLLMLATQIADQSISEAFVDERFDFEDVLFTRYVQSDSGSVWYPKPGTDRYITWYQFLDDDLVSGDSTQWLYREIWEDPERPKLEAKDEENSLPCVFLYNVDPAIDQYDMEHRKCADEGAYTLRFSAPVFNDGGEIETDAYFKFGLGPERYFDIDSFAWKDDVAVVGGVEIAPKYSYWNGGGGEWESYPNLWSTYISIGDKNEAKSYGYYYTTYDTQALEEYEYYFFPGVRIDVRDFKFPYRVSDYLTGIEYDTSFNTNPEPNHPFRKVDVGWTDYLGSKLASGGSLSPNNHESLSWDKIAGSVDLVIDIGAPITLAELKIAAGIGSYNDTFIVGQDLSIYIGVLPECTVYGSNDYIGPYTELFSFTEVSYNQVFRNPGKVSQFTVTSDPSSVSSFVNRYRYYKLSFDELTEDNAALLLMWVQFKSMELVDRTETPIILSEQKFYKTTAPIEGDFNFHGTRAYPMINVHESNSSIYLYEPRVRGLMGTSPFKAFHKCRARGGDSYHRDKEDIQSYKGGESTCELEKRQELLWNTARDQIGDNSSYDYTAIRPLREYLEEYGINFSAFISNLTSSVPQLTDEIMVNAVGEPLGGCSSFAAAGHRYVNSRSLVWREICGGIGSGCGAYHRAQWTCEYCFKHIDHVGYHGESDECNLAVNPATIYSTIIVPAAFSGRDDWSDVGGEDIRKFAARDWVFKAWVDDNWAQ